MKLAIKRLALTCLVTCVLTSQAFAADITVTRAGQYLGAMMEILLSEYVGAQLTAEDLYIAAARGMTAVLDDYTEYLTEYEYYSMIYSLQGNYIGLGIQFRMLLDGRYELTRVFDGSPAGLAGMQKNDVIVSVNGMTVNGYDDKPLAVRIAEAGNTVALVITRSGERLRFSITKTEVLMPTVERGLLGDYLPEAAGKPMGYILCTQVSEQTAQEMREAIDWLKERDVTQVVMDFRNNPGGLRNVTEEISQLFVPRGAVYSTTDSDGERAVFSSSLDAPPFAGIALLVNADTASASELFVAAMQDARAATVIGQTTFGKGIIQHIVGLDAGDALKYTAMEYLRRSGRPLHGIGVTPDVVVPKPQHIGKDIFYLNNDGTGVGTNVSNLKRLLAYIGYDVDASDPRYDKRTQTAVADIQSLAKLTPTGYFDFQTLIAVNTAYNLYLADNDAELARAYEVLTATE